MADAFPCPPSNNDVCGEVANPNVHDGSGNWNGRGKGSENQYEFVEIENPRQEEEMGMKAHPRINPVGEAMWSELIAEGTAISQKSAIGLAQDGEHGGSGKKFY